MGSVYTMEAMQFRAGSWVPQEAPFTLVLSRSAGDGVFLSVAGEAISDPAAMSLDEVARQPFRDLYDPEIALFRDGWPTPAGPGLQDTALFFSQAGVREELPGEGLVQNEGDMWVRYGEWRPPGPMCTPSEASGWETAASRSWPPIQL